MTPPPGKPPRPVPEWLIGLAIAIVVVALGALILSFLGAGDDPTFSEGATLAGLGSASLSLEF
ncbi:MAG: hypothetical protein R3246_02965 [Acidimicrobiia bacterium]|nr:hypothetical protein [Acidimicrobiia bacterium]